MLPEISIAPMVFTNFVALIKPGFKKDLDSFLKNRASVSLTNLQSSSSGASEAGM